MHSIHTMAARDHLNPMQLQQQQQVQEMQHQPEAQEPNRMSVLELHPQSEAPESRMSVLEMLEPSQQLAEQQQMMGLMEPQQQPQLVQHLVPTNSRPLLHQLQPSHAGAASHDSLASLSQVQQSDEQSLMNQQQQLLHHHQQQQQQVSGSTQSNSNNLLRVRPQIEGIVADGGQPIVTWLVENYEVADGESLPRSTVYNHYLAHCRHMQMASVNAASFGKLIRSVFIGLKTRRLGTRGHSKYHYFGVRAKQHIQQELLLHQESNAGCSREQNNENSNQNTDNGSESDSTGNGLDCGRLSSSSSGKRVKRVSNGGQRRRPSQHIYMQQQQQQPNQQQAADLDHQHHHHHTQQQQQQEQQQKEAQHIELSSNGLYYTNNSATNGFMGSKSMNSDPNNGSSSEHLLSADHCELNDFRNHLGANWDTLVDEHWPQREACLLERQLIKATGVSELADSLCLFETNYKAYYKRMVELLSELKFSDVEQLWQEFWHPDDSETDQQWHMSSSEQSGASPADLETHQRFQSQQVMLPFQTMYQLTGHPQVIDWINQIDYNLYAAIESFLLPDMLSPIPRPLAQQIRLFAKNIGPYIEHAVKDYGSQFVAEKSKTARAFGHALRRYTSLNHLSTASRAIWEKRSSLAQMSEDLNRVDLRDIEHQVSLMSHGNNETSAGLMNVDLQSTRNNPNSQSESNEVQNNTTSTTNTITNTTITSTNNSNNNNVKGSAINDNSLIDHNHCHPHHLCAMQPAQLIQNFLHLLEDPYPANSWPDWCRNLVESRVCGLSVEEARNFVLKWNFYISLIMKELTLRSAPSFGSFQLIRLLFDEYIFYLVVTRLAQAQHKTAAQLLSL